MAAPFTDLRMESMHLILPDPGLRRDDDEQVNRNFPKNNKSNSGVA
jgi:hypothetical protein